MRDGKIHVLFFVSRCPACGTVNVLRDILRHCPDEAFSFSLLTTLPEDPDNSVLPEFTARMEHIFVPMSVGKGLAGFWGDVKKAIDRLNPDVIHSTWLVPDRIVSRLWPQKQLMLLHADFLPDYAYTYGLFPGLALTWLHLRAARRAHCVVAVSESLAGIFAAKYGMNVPFVRNGVSLPEGPAPDKRAAREALGLPAERTVFVCAATLSRRKNQRFLIGQFEKGAADGPLLVLLGDGPALRRLRKKARNAVHTRFEGFVSNVEDYLYAADYYVSASRSEGLGLAVIEAMRCGLPPLLSDIQAHREIVSLSDGGGECFHSGDAASFREALERLTKKDYARASEQSRETVRRHFNAEAMSAAYQAYYKKIWEEGEKRGGT